MTIGPEHDGRYLHFLESDRAYQRAKRDWTDPADTSSRLAMLWGDREHARALYCVGLGLAPDGPMPPMPHGFPLRHPAHSGG